MADALSSVATLSSIILILEKYWLHLCNSYTFLASGCDTRSPQPQHDSVFSHFCNLKCRDPSCILRCLEVCMPLSTRHKPQRLSYPLACVSTDSCTFHLCVALQHPHLRRSHILVSASVDDLRAEVTASAWLNDLRTQIEHTRILRTVYRSASALGSRLPSIASAKAKVAGAVI
nr:mono-/di-acylglycerol lipase, lipase, class 3 [Tanacetum cinerariifolium]